MTEPNDAVPAANDRPAGAGRPIEGEPDDLVPVEEIPEAQREAEQTIRSISRLEERN